MTFRRKVALAGLAWSAALLMASPILLMALTAFKTDAAADLGPLAPFTPTLANFASQNPNVSMLRPALNSIVEAGGGTLDDVGLVTVLLTDPADFPGMNEAYAAFFPADPPARAVTKLGVELPNVLVSIMLTAHLD